ncbi:hypothetical protein FRZ44_38180 [Hypericibacter terrae]|uniref:Uncharacterized protein n=1 Tax=Hypericibacter terrae TaxID=2602015 RepID=A0A5J6MMU1_9PROT|nr:hypothetical protein [Hypericibacter terrae]QEX18511.1 hypothetical protein FRZ44_38180 [Hypericibacter terrae]
MRLRENYPTIQTIQKGSRKTLRSLDIEALLHWTYQRQKADLVIDRGQGLHRLEAEADGIEIQSRSADGCARIAEIIALGAKIEGLGRPAGELHPDAEAVHEAILVRRKDRETGRSLALTPLQRGLLLVHARQGDRPDWLPGAVQRWEPVRKADGSVKVVWGREGRKDLPSHCEIRLAISQEEIDLARWVYGQWWSGMAWLRWYLTQHKLLKDHGATGPAVASAPWNSASDSRAAA